MMDQHVAERLQITNSTLRERIAALEKKITTLRQIIYDYGRHSEDCSYPYSGEEYGCKCRWLEVVREVREET